MCCLRNIALRDYQESVTTGQTDAGQSDPYVPLCFAGDTKIVALDISLRNVRSLFKTRGATVTGCAPVVSFCCTELY